MTESQFTDALRRKLQGRIYPLKLNLRFMRGVPDCWYSGSISDLWNEHKYLKSVPALLDLTDQRRLTLHQQMWLEQRHQEGRNVAVIVGHPEGAVLFRDLDWKEPISRDVFLARSLTISEMAQELVSCLGAIK